MEKHIETIFELFSQIQRFGLKIHLEKCSFKISVPSIGHDVHRHANQLRRRLPIELDDDEVTDPEEPPITHEEDARDELPSPHKPIEKPPARQSPRAKRERRPPRRLELDPQQKTYTYVR